MDGTEKSREDMPCREKYWNELHNCEKSDRVRREVKRLQEQVDYLTRMVNALLEHTHADGRIVTSLLHGPYEASSSTKQAGGDYF